MRFFNIFICCLFLLQWMPVSEAGTRMRVWADVPTTPVTFECVKASADRYDVPIAALFGILAVEGGAPGEALRNGNGSWDMGPFQINSWWAGELMDAGIDPMVMLHNGCANTLFAGWILRQELDRGHDIWKAIGAYHSPNGRRQQAYIQAVKNALLKLNVEAILQKANRGKP